MLPLIIHPLKLCPRFYLRDHQQGTDLTSTKINSWMLLNDRRLTFTSQQVSQSSTQRFMWFFLLFDSEYIIMTSWPTCIWLWLWCWDTALRLALYPGQACVPAQIMSTLAEQQSMRKFCISAQQCLMYLLLLFYRPTVLGSCSSKMYIFYILSVQLTGCLRVQ